jgi:hypothetical protein
MINFSVPFLSNLFEFSISVKINFLNFFNLLLFELNWLIFEEEKV